MSLVASSKTVSPRKRHRTWLITNCIPEARASRPKISARRRLTWAPERAIVAPGDGGVRGRDLAAVRPRRSVLFMPGSNARALEKARTLAADVLVLDLEDAVAPEMKLEARAQVAAAVRAGGYGHREIVVRVNALNTPWGRDDLAAAAAAGADAVLLPKVEAAESVSAALPA